MTRFGWMVALGCGIALAGVAILVWGFARQSGAHPATNAVERSPVVDPSSLSIYTNGVYGFSFFYPSDAVALDASSSQSWRMNPIGTGSAIVSVKLASGEVRVGASEEARAVSSCLKPGPSESAQDSLAVQGITWHVFGYDLLGTDNQQHVTSYRTVHGGTCFAVESFEPILPSAPSAQSGAATSTATTAARDAAVVVRNFSFAR